MSERPDFVRNHGLVNSGNGSASQAVLQWIGSARRELGSVRANLEKAASHVQANQAGIATVGQGRSQAMLRVAEAVKEADLRAEEIQGIALGRGPALDASADAAAMGGK